MLEYDIVVIGGGATGLSAAKTAAEHNQRVLLLEMRAAIGWQSHHVLCEKVPKEFKQSVTSKTRNLKIICSSKNIEIEGKFSVLDYSKLLRSMAVEATKAGVEIWTSAPVKDLLVDFGRVIGVKAAGGGWVEEIKSKVVIDASGSSGDWSGLFMKKFASHEWSGENLAFRCEYLMANANCEKAEIHLSSYSAPGGFGWIFPVEEGLASTGVLGLRIHPGTALDEFIGRVAHPCLKGASPIVSVKTSQPMSGPLTKLWEKGILAAGKSAGQIPPLAVNILRYEIECGRLAGDAASLAAAGDSEALSEYDAKWRKTLGEEIQKYSKLWRGLGTMQDKKVSRFLEIVCKNEDTLRDFVKILLAETPHVPLTNILSNSEISSILTH
ncbi:MAG: NAD(P)/FAD-dependent oxidoreductase [Candidatus Hadarchaeales archaeon]